MLRVMPRMPFEGASDAFTTFLMLSSYWQVFRRQVRSTTDTLEREHGEAMPEASHSAQG